MSDYKTKLVALMVSFGLVACNKAPVVENVSPLPVGTSKSSLSEEKGKLANQFTPSATKVETISGKHTHQGDFTFNGDVADGAEIRVKGGGVHIKGKVGNNVKIIQENVNRLGVTQITQNSNSVSNTGDGNTIIIDGKRVVSPQSNQDENPSKISGVTIDGNAGAQLKIESSSSVTLKNVGEKSRVVAQNGIIVNDIGQNSVFRAGSKITVQSVGDGSRLNAGSSIDGQATVGKESVLRAGNSIVVGTVKEYANLNAGNSIHATSADPTANLTAGNSVVVVNKPRGNDHQLR